MKEEDSFEEYKGELEKELGICDLKPPTKPMNAYMRFFLERSSEERAKGESSFGELSSAIAAEWNALAAHKRDFYQQIYEIRCRERDGLLVQFELLSNQRRVLSPYSRFIKKRYLQYSKEYRTLSSLELTKLANEDWRKLSLREKDRLRQEFEDEKADLELGIDRSDQVSEYQQSLERYHGLLEEDKNKILRKYGLSAEHKARVRLDSLERRRETKRLIKDIKQEFRKEGRKKYRESVKQRARAEAERIHQIAEDQIEQEKNAIRAERAKIRGEKAQLLLEEKDDGKTKSNSQKAVKIQRQRQNVKITSQSKKTQPKLTKTKNISKNVKQAKQKKVEQSSERKTRSKR